MVNQVREGSRDSSSAANRPTALRLEPETTEARPRGREARRHRLRRGALHGLERGDRRRLLARRAPDPAADAGRAAAQALPRGRVQLRYRGPDGRAARRERDLRGRRRFGVQAPQSVAHLLERRRGTPAGSSRSSPRAGSSTPSRRWPRRSRRPTSPPSRWPSSRAATDSRSSPRASPDCAPSIGYGTQCSNRGSAADQCSPAPAAFGLARA